MDLGTAQAIGRELAGEVIRGQSMAVDIRARVAEYVFEGIAPLPQPLTWMPRRSDREEEGDDESTGKAVAYLVLEDQVLNVAVLVGGRF
jgi:hypothetical protein